VNDAAIRRRPAVISMSVGTGFHGHLVEAVAWAHARGVQLFTGAQNLRENACNFSPAFAPLAVTVGGINLTDNPYIAFAGTRGSNLGPCVDLRASGRRPTAKLKIMAKLGENLYKTTRIYRYLEGKTQSVAKPKWRNFLQNNAAEQKVWMDWWRSPQSLRWRGGVEDRHRTKPPPTEGEGGN